jgi:hypothetical protein
MLQDLAAQPPGKYFIFKAKAQKAEKRLSCLTQMPFKQSSYLAN